LIIELNTSQGIDWGAAGVARRLQNINTALNTYRYEVAFNRTFGRNPANLDKPLNQYIQAVIAETYEIVQEVDSKAKVIEVIPDISEPGDLSLKVVIELE
jgi:hypothetical protein